MISFTAINLTVDQSFARGWYVHARYGVHWMTVAYADTKKEALAARAQIRRAMRNLKPKGRNK